MKTNKKLYLLLFLAGLIAACDVSYFDKEIEDVSWDGNVKIPAGFINYNLSEIFNDIGSSDLSPTSTEEFSFSYSKSFSGVNNDAFNVKIDDTNIESSIESPITQVDLDGIGESFPYTITQEISPGVTNPLIGTYQRSNQKVHDLNLSKKLTEVSFDGGLFTITFTSKVDASIDLTVTIPSFKKKTDGGIFTQTVTISGETQETITLNLDEYSVDLTNDGTGTGKTTNKVVIDVNSSFTFAAGNQLDADDAISYKAVISNVSYEVIYGDFKQETFNVSSNTIDLGDFFDNFSEGDVSFENVTMSIDVTNDYGFPISMDLSSVKAVNNSSSVNLTYTGNQSLANTIIVDEVANFGDAEKMTSVTLDNSNSNIGTLLESKPSSLEFDVSGSANPLNSGGVNTNFYAKNNTGLSAEVKINFDKVSLDKEIDFDGAEDLDDFKYIKIVASVENKIPLTGDIVLEFKDNSNQIVHTESLNAFQAANLGQNGQSDGVAVSSNFEIELNETEISNITNASKINVRVTLQLPTGKDSVVIKGSDELEVNVGIEANASITSED
ncbi:hypothetical protein [Polaribacter septentrionalilitoris]|uniref:hypothetical protein n=1 Tax=Polaribacter septentrionalilitoris TaxID=2494657 RepID=UPI001356E69A|nr:hypothetical protein [Polaribacter septentrionalilitoris]